MNKLIFTCIATALVAAPMATVVKAEETTIIKRDRDRDREVIKEREGGDRLSITHISALAA
jgi:Ni/Co efflux regulator RcnB